MYYSNQFFFNEITLDVLFQYREWFFAFVPTYEYLLTLKNPRNFYAFPAKQQIVFNSTLLDCQKENFLVSHTKNYDKVVLDYGLRPEQLNQKYLESESALFEDILGVEKEQIFLQPFLALIILPLKSLGGEKLKKNLTEPCVKMLTELLQNVLNY